MSDSFSFIRRLSLAPLRVFLRLRAEKVGEDEHGNIYFRARRAAFWRKERRWVLFADEPEASKISPRWHVWMHHTVVQPLPAQSEHSYVWQRAGESNQTGTPRAYLPSRHPLGNAARGAARGQDTKASQDPFFWRP